MHIVYCIQRIVGNSEFLTWIGSLLNLNVYRHVVFFFFLWIKLCQVKPSMYCWLLGRSYPERNRVVKLLQPCSRLFPHVMSPHTLFFSPEMLISSFFLKKIHLTCLHRRFNFKLVFPNFPQVKWISPYIPLRICVCVVECVCVLVHPLVFF